MDAINAAGFKTFQNCRAFTISETLIEFWINNSVFYPISKR